MATLAEQLDRSATAAADAASASTAAAPQSSSSIPGSLGVKDALKLALHAGGLGAAAPWDASSQAGDRLYKVITARLRHLREAALASPALGEGTGAAAAVANPSAEAATAELRGLLWLPRWLYCADDAAPDSASDAQLALDEITRSRFERLAQVSC